MNALNFKFRDCEVSYDGQRFDVVDEPKMVTAKLLHSIDYKNGYVSNRNAVDEPTEIECELIESGCVGWGAANAIVRDENGCYYLAEV